MRKLFLGFAAFGIVMVLAACSATSEKFSLDSDEDVFSVAAISSVELLSNTNISQLNNNTSGISMSSDLIINPSTTYNEIDENDMMLTLDEVQPYIEIFEQLLADQNGLGVVVEASDLAEYATKQTFTARDITGGNITYVMYYNETLESEDEEDDETSYQIEGIFIVGDLTYTFVGERESEGDESELKFKAYIDELNYVLVKYELESEEIKFEFEKVVDGVTVEESEIKIEDEEDEFKIELRIFTITQENYYEFKLEEEDGETILKIEYQITVNGETTEGEAKVYVIIDELTGETSYQMVVSDGDDTYEKEYDRDLDDLEDDEEDEEDEEDEDDTETEEDEE
ncbi:MAG: hypothetical protein V3569_01255 [Acholeplasmataceae bacterium]|nr:hypothetical protein [Acholeplasmataceae bacterium]